MRDRPARSSARASSRCTPAPRTASCPDRPSSASASSTLTRGRHHRHHPAAARASSCANQAAAPSRRSSARPSGASTGASRWARCSRRRSSSSRRCSSGASADEDDATADRRPSAWRDRRAGLADRLTGAPTDDRQADRRATGADRDDVSPDADGGLEPVAGETGDYRDRLRSRRWDAAPLRNPEVERPTRASRSPFIVGSCCVLTFVARRGRLRQRLLEAATPSRRGRPADAGRRPSAAVRCRGSA